MSVRGKTVLVTGGGGGIGLAVASALAQRGACVAIVDADRERVHAADQIANIASYTLDVRDRDAYADVVTRIGSDLGPIDVLINNAGVMALAPLVDVDFRAACTVIDVNLIGTLNGLQLVLPGMLDRGSGHILNVSSVAGKWPVPGENVYVATKFAIGALTDLARRELRETGVRFTTVYMGPISGTDLSLGMRPQRLVRFSTPQAVAAAVAQVIERPRTEVWVPESLRWSVAAIDRLPRGLRERVHAALGVNQIATDIDARARAEYELRLLHARGE